MHAIYYFHVIFCKNARRVSTVSCFKVKKNTKFFSAILVHTELFEFYFWLSLYSDCYFILYHILYVLQNNPRGLSALPYFASWTKSTEFWSESLISGNFPLLFKLTVWLSLTIMYLKLFLEIIQCPPVGGKKSKWKVELPFRMTRSTGLFFNVYLRVLP